ncbi:MAG: enoyl-CoA hydratase/isomerase family protein [Candidatus Cloacimonetes bacterium]|nr:enoyl-CoA hydratase/isomerase family protein [Candidatus Cloacimonadota bacterium]
MDTVSLKIENHIATVTLNRGKVNAMNHQMIQELNTCFVELAQNNDVRGAILTGHPGIFSAGLDVVELYSYDREKINQFFLDFSILIKNMLSFYKPLISAINGHCPAGGCVLAICTDFRIMAEGDYTIGLNELPVGIVVPDPIYQIYSSWIGPSKAYQYIMEGRLLSVEDAKNVNLIQATTSTENVMNSSLEQVQKYIQFGPAFIESKKNIRAAILKSFDLSFDEVFGRTIQTWWSEPSRKKLEFVIQQLMKRSK